MSWRSEPSSLRLDRRLMLTYGGLFLGIVVALLSLAWGRISVLEEANEERLAKALGQTLAGSVHQISFTGKDHASLLLEGYIESNPELEYIVIEKFDGSIYAEAQRKGISGAEFGNATALSTSTAVVGKTLSKTLEVAGLPILEITTPFVEGYLGEAIGTLRVGLDRTLAHENTLNGLLSLLGFGLLIAFAGGLMLFKVSRKVAAPVHDLAATFEGLLRHAPLLISIQDRSGRVVRASKSLLDTFKLDPQAQQLWVHEYRSADYSEERAEEDEAIFAGERSIFNETRTLTVEGIERRYAVTRFPLYAGPSQRVEQICSLALDITEKLELEAHLEQTRRMETIGQFAGGVAHDFNNLLMAIMGSAELLAGATQDEDKVRSLSAEITRSGQAATELTGRLLSFGRRQILTTADVDVDRMLDEFRGFLERILREDIELEIRLSGESLWVHADRGQLEQVLMNLIANARDAMPKGGKISISARAVQLGTQRSLACKELPPGDYIELVVKDTGTGISPDLADRILDPFITTKDLGKGTGLGLSIVHGIVEQHGGSLHFDSMLDRGTTFTILLPRIAAGAESLEVPRQADQSEPLHILIVEDNDDVRQFVHRALEHLGHTVTEARDGVEALERLSTSRTHFDLLLVDVIMPHMGGDQLYRELVKMNFKVPVLFMTGHDRAALADLRAEFHERGASIRAIQKPFEIQALGQAIAETLAEARKLGLRAQHSPSS